MSVYCLLLGHGRTVRHRNGRHVEDSCSRCGKTLREREIDEWVFDELPESLFGHSNASI